MDPRFTPQTPRSKRSLRRVLALVIALTLIISGLGATSAAAAPPGDPDSLIESAFPGSQMFRTQVSPDGQHIVFIGDRVDERRFELWRLSPDGGPATAISGPIVEGGDVSQFEISPDSTSVVFRGDVREEGRVELFSVPITGGEVELLTTIAHGDVTEHFDVSPDSSRVVYLARQNVGDGREIYGAPLDASSSASRMNPPLDPGHRAVDFAITPDSAAVVFRADVDELDAFQLYRSAITGGGADRISGLQQGHVPIPHGSVHFFDVTPDGDQVVFRAERLSLTGDSLYVVPTAGGVNPVRITPEIGTVTSEDIAPDGDTVVYRADQDTAGVRELYAVPIAGGDPWKVSRDFNTDGDVVGFNPVIFTPDGVHVVYEADGEQDALFELYAARVDGTGAWKLSPTPTVDGGSVWFGHRLTPDGTRVVFMGDLEEEHVGELYSVPVTGGTPIKVTPPLNPWESPGGWGPVFTPDSEWVAYALSSGNQARSNAYVTRVGGGEIVQLNGELGPDEVVGDVRVIDEDTVLLVFVDFETGEGQRMSVVDVAHRCDGHQATITGTPGDDVIDGTPGPDVIVGLGGDDVINGLGGDDIICGNQGRDEIRGGAGADRLFGQKGRDRISGGSSGDFISGGSGSDRLRGNSGEDVIEGRSGNDLIIGGSADDTLRGNGGNDEIRGGAGDDDIRGGKKNDVLRGQNGDDDIRGNSGHDTLNGGNGTDTCSGGSGTDTGTKCETEVGI